MVQRKRILFAAIAALACTAWSPAVMAEPDEETDIASPPQAAPAPRMFGLPALDTRALAGERGGTDVFNDMKLKGVVADNHAIDLATGNNVITDGAFSGAAGLPMVIQNSGNNVLIQSATIVNVQVK